MVSSIRQGRGKNKFAPVHVFLMVLLLYPFSVILSPSHDKIFLTCPNMGFPITIVSLVADVGRDWRYRKWQG